MTHVFSPRGGWNRPASRTCTDGTQAGTPLYHDGTRSPVTNSTFLPVSVWSEFVRYLLMGIGNKALAFSVVLVGRLYLSEKTANLLTYLIRPLALPGWERMSNNLSAFPTLFLGFLRPYREIKPTTQHARVPRPLSNHTGQMALALLPCHLRSAK